MRLRQTSFLCTHCFPDDDEESVLYYLKVRPHPLCAVTSVLVLSCLISSRVIWGGWAWKIMNWKVILKSSYLEKKKGFCLFFCFCFCFCFKSKTDFWFFNYNLLKHHSIRKSDCPGLGDGWVIKFLCKHDELAPSTQGKSLCGLIHLWP